MTGINPDKHLQELFDGWGILSPQHTLLRERILKSYKKLLGSSNVCSNIATEVLSREFVDTDIPEEPCTPENYIEFLNDTVITHSINMSSPRCLGHMTTASPAFIYSISELITGMNQNLVKCDASKVLTLLERQILAILHRLVFKKPEEFYCENLNSNDSILGIMTSGGTLANTTALWCARNSVFSPQGDFQGVEENGILAALEHYQYQKAVVVGSELMHYSIEKAVAVLGIGAKNTIKVPVNNKSQLDLKALEAIVKQCKNKGWRIVSIVGVAGTTDCGTVDPLDDIADIAASEGAHFHVDAAWGAPLLLSEMHSNKLTGIDRADSVTIDGHKQFYLPIGVGMLMLRNPNAAKVLEKQASYILQEDSSDLGKFSLEGSRPAIALLLHAALNVIGRQGYERMLNESIRKADLLANLINDSDEFELLTQPETNIVLYRYNPLNEHGESVNERYILTNDDLNTLNQSIQSRQYQAGRTFVSRTTLKHLSKYPGQPVIALRAIITNPHTTIDDIKVVLSDQLTIGRELIRFTSVNTSQQTAELN